MQAFSHGAGKGLQRHFCRGDGRIASIHLAGDLSVHERAPSGCFLYLRLGPLMQPTLARGTIRLRAMTPEGFFHSADRRCKQYSTLSSGVNCIASESGDFGLGIGLGPGLNIRSREEEGGNAAGRRDEGEVTQGLVVISKIVRSQGQW